MTAGIAYLLLDVDVRTAILLGAVASSTDAAAVFAVLRRLPFRGRLRATVEAESGFNDPPVIILVTVVTSSAWARLGGGRRDRQIALPAGARRGRRLARRPGRRVCSVRSALPASGLYPLATLGIAFLAYAVAGVAGASPFLPIYVTGLIARQLAAAAPAPPSASSRRWPGWRRSACSSCSACWPARPPARTRCRSALVVGTRAHVRGPAAVGGAVRHRRSGCRCATRRSSAGPACAAPYPSCWRPSR